MLTASASLLAASSASAAYQSPTVASLIGPITLPAAAALSLSAATTATVATASGSCARANAGTRAHGNSTNSIRASSSATNNNALARALAPPTVTVSSSSSSSSSVVRGRRGGLASNHAQQHQPPLPTVASITRLFSMISNTNATNSAHGASGFYSDIGTNVTDPYVSLLLSLERRAAADPTNVALQEELARELCLYSTSAFLARYESGAFPRTPVVAELYDTAKSLHFASIRGVPHSTTNTYTGSHTGAYTGGAGNASASFGSSAGAGSNGGGFSLSSPVRPLDSSTIASPPPISFRSLLNLIISLLSVAFLAVAYNTVRAGPGGPGGISGIGKNGASEVLPENCKVRFEDVKGCDEARAEAQELVEFLKNPKKFNSMGAEIPRGLLLTGPPGTGKTLLAKAVAGEAGVPFFFISGSSFDEMFVGTGAKKVRELFAAAKAKAPCIIFIDEIDAVGGARSKKQESYHRQTLNALLVEMDGFEPNDGVIVMGATNLSDALDKALLRPGRFDRQLVLDLPDVRGRKQILDHYIAKTRPAGDVDTSVLARATPGASGAMLKSLVNSAAILATQLGRETVSMSELEHAKDKMLMGAARVTAIIPEPVRRKTAYHEGGHAICALFTEGAMPIYKATIMPRGNALGMVMQLPEDDVVSMTKKEMLARLDVCMGGRVAEEVMYGMDNVSSGASGDFEQATALAQRMVMSYGLGKAVGVRSIRDLDGLSTETRAKVDEEVRAILTDSYNRSKALITRNKDKLERLAEGLIKYETITLEEITMVVEGKPLDREF